jgi:hypothetical protein
MARLEDLRLRSPYWLVRATSGVFRARPCLTATYGGRKRSDQMSLGRNASGVPGFADNAAAAPGRRMWLEYLGGEPLPWNGHVQRANCSTPLLTPP